MTVVLRAGLLVVSIQIFGSLALAQNAPADADKPAADKTSAVPAPPTPSTTLQDAKPARPTAAPNSAPPKPPAAGFITAPAPVLPVAAPSPSTPHSTGNPSAATNPRPALTRSLQLPSATPANGTGDKPTSPPVDAGATDPGPKTAPPLDAAPATSDTASKPALPPGAASKTAAGAPDGDAKPALPDVAKSTEVKAGDGVAASKPPAIDLHQTAAVVASVRNVKKLSRDEILTATSDNLAIYVLRDNERTLVLDFPNIREQAKMFARLILFIERAGTPKTRVMTVPEVRKWSTDNSTPIEALTVGNNMRTGELARFFNSARFQGEPITVDEQRLYDALLDLQLLREESGGVSVVDPERILVSVPQASSVAGCPGCTINAAQRAVILQHELAHARFATDTVYQNYAIWFWANALSLVQRDKFQKFLRARGYDSTIRELCANEMQAFLMHTPDPRMFSAADVSMTDPELADLRQRFIEGLAPRPRAAVDKAYQFE